MKNICLFGAGRSSLYLVDYLATYCDAHDMQLKVCDKEVEYAEKYAAPSKNSVFIDLDIFDQVYVTKLVADSEIVISLLPAALHIHIALLCLEHGKNLATASYISDEMKALDARVREKGLVFLNECGLDPGIDHMSAMQIMDEIRERGGEISRFESYCGGLIADEDDGDNPWRYKFTWNPRNVVLAGQGAPAVFLENSNVKIVPYHQLFRSTRTFDIEDYGKADSYPNRDSLKYRELYQLSEVETMKRGTLRKHGYCEAWHALVNIGLTDDSIPLVLDPKTTMKQWILSFLPESSMGAEDLIKHYTGCSDEVLEKIKWLGFFSDELLPVSNGTPAKILEEILKLKWSLREEDKDLVLMLHLISYKLEGVTHSRQATMVLKGVNNTHTAMAKTVGLPLAIASRLILEGKISMKGVIAPVDKEIYEPVLRELYRHGLEFSEKILE